MQKSPNLSRSQGMAKLCNPDYLSALAVLLPETIRAPLSFV